MSNFADISTERWMATGLDPRRSLRVFGMRRTGNHAIIDWILRNAGGSGSVFFNNCIAGRSPTEGFRTIAINGQRKSTRDAQQDLAKICAPAGRNATFVVSYEDLAPTADRKHPLSGALDNAFNADLVLYRSFLNWCASLLKKLQNNPVWTPTKRAAIMLGSVDTYRQLLTLVRSAEDLKITPVCYDDWTRSDTYRRDSLDSLGLKLRDNTLGAVQDYGGGSSFEGRGGTAGGAGTTERYDQMQDDQELQQILAVSARDTALMGELDTLFPEDAARLRARHGETPK